MKYETFCLQCKRSCSETVYDYTISSKLLSIMAVNELLKKEYAAKNISNVMKNYLLVKFYFQEMVEMQIIEDFLFSDYDVFSYISGYLGLFLGISVITSYELVHQILYSFISAYQYNKREKKKKQKFFLCSP